MSGHVLFLPGNGHASVRLNPARTALESLAPERRFALTELPYPIEATFDATLAAVARRADAWREGCRGDGSAPERRLIMATGIGGLVALALRASGRLLEDRLVLQGPVLWGLEQRRFPRLMRLGIGPFKPGPQLLVQALKLPALRRRFAAKHFVRDMDPEFIKAFFAGYLSPQEFAAWFRWLTPDLLRSLERKLPSVPGALVNLELWWGERDHVVGLDELARTERALGRQLPCRRFPDWGHYPMIQDPGGWVREVVCALETPH